MLGWLPYCRMVAVLSLHSQCMPHHHPTQRLHLFCISERSAPDLFFVTQQRLIYNSDRTCSNGMLQ